VGPASSGSAGSGSAGYPPGLGLGSLSALAPPATTMAGPLPSQPDRGPARTGVSAAMLLSPAEVGRALGVPVTTGDNPSHGGPMSMAEYAGTDGRPVLYVGTVAGRIARNVMRLPGKAEPIPDIGDEAYSGEHWVSARRGDQVVLLQLRGDAQLADDRDVHWLLDLAANRLPG
jgi:hypothetical protein